MKRLASLSVVLAFAAVLAASVQAQELMYDQREIQVSYDGSVSVPSLVFNGKDFAVFYYWAGTGDEGSGLHMRRVGLDGKPKGPQRQVMPLELNDPFAIAVWDGSAYNVYMTQFHGITIHIFRVSEAGNLLAYKKVPVDPSKYAFRRLYPFVVGERSFLFFSTKGNFFVGDGQGGQAYMISHDRDLKETPTLSKLSSAGLDSSVINGVALDPDKFLVLLCHYSGSFEIQEAALLHLGFDGKLKKTVKPSLFNPSRAGTAEQVDTSDLGDVVGPLFTGNGYLLIGTKNFYFTAPAPASSYPYENTSLKIDDGGQIVDGPFDLGNGASSLYLGTPKLLGQYVGMPINDLVAFDSQLLLMGERGKHITDVSLHEEKYGLFYPVSTSFAYSGWSCFTTNLGRKDRFDTSSALGIFSNILSDPPFVKPEVFYFMAGSKDAFGDTRRLVMWSVSSGSKFSLKGPGVNMKNLPAVFHTVVDTKGKTTKLKLRYKGTDGKNRKSKLVINP